MQTAQFTIHEYPVELLKELYLSMLKIRVFEDRIVELYPEQDMKCPVHLYIGQEAIAAGVSASLRKTDYVFSNHRSHGHYIAKGGDTHKMMAELYGKTSGCSKGKGGSMHLVDIENGVPGTSAIVGGGIPMAVGAALSSRLRNDGRVSIVYFGDGAYEEGVFYESFNFALLKKLPVVFVCENNFYATNSPQSARQANCRISDAAFAFRAKGVCIDGNDVVAVYASAKEAIVKARAGAGPTLIEALTYRWKGHVGPEADHLKGCRPKEELDDWMERCPVRNFNELLVSRGMATAEELIEMRRITEKEADDAVAFAKKGEYPTEADLMTDVYCETPQGGD